MDKCGKLFLFLLLGVAAILQSPCQGQALPKLTEVLERGAQLAALNEHTNLRKEVLEAMTALDDLWTVYLPGLLEESGSENATISDACYNSTKAVLLGTTLLQPNVTIPEILPLIDATGKQGAGLLAGNLILDAAFDECFKYDYTGYCMGKVELSFIPSTSPVSWTAGLCVPKHCSPSDVAAVMNFARVFRVDESDMKCTDTKSPAFSPGSIVMIVVCVVFGVLVAVGTVLDKLLEYITPSSAPETGYVAINDTTISGSSTISGSGGEKTPLLTRATAAGKQPVCKVKWHEFITAFSLYKTVPTILATRQAPSVITSLNGLRVISMFWVILGHTYVWYILNGFYNVIELVNLVKHFSFQAVLNGTFSVDSFFFLSGVLVAYLSLRQMKRRNGRFPFLHYYIHRYLRLTPTYAFVLFFAWFLTRHIAAGPSLSLSDSFGPACAKYWWTNLLYINNFYPWKMGEQCSVWTWYLANDMQFYIISPLMLIPAYFLLPVGAVVSSAFLLCSFLITAVLAGVYDISPSMMNDPRAPSLYQDVVYEMPWSRIQPYIVGLVLGFVLYKGIRLPLNRKVNALLYLIMWVAVAVLLASPVYGLYPEVHGYILSKAEKILYITFSRCSWGLGLALLVFACHNGYGGPINAFLSMKMWTPLSRMTFNAYLMHPVVLTVIYGQLEKPVHLTDFTMATYAVAFVVLSYAVAGVVCVGVEFPLGSVEMLLFKLFGLEGRNSQRQGKEAGKETEEGEEKERGGVKA